MAETDRDIGAPDGRTGTFPARAADLRVLVEQLPVSVAMFDREMLYLAASEPWLAAFGGDERNVKGRSLYELLPQIPERWKEALKRCLAGETVSADADPLPRRDGRTQHVRWEVRPWRCAGGDVGGIMIFAEDVSARIETEQALRESNANLATEVEARTRLNQAGSRLWNAQSLRRGLDEMLTATIELLGADMGSIQLLEAERRVLRIVAHRGFKQDFLDFLAEVSADDETACGRALRSGRPVVIEDVELDPPYAPFRSIARAAGYRAVISAPMISPRGNFLGIISAHFRSPHRPSHAELQHLELYLRPATGFVQRNRYEDRLRESGERLRLALEAGRTSMWDWNLRTGAVSWNKETYEMLGYEAGEVPPSYAAWAVRVHPEDRPAAETVLAESLRERKEYNNEFRVLLPNGAVRWCLSRGRATYDDAGEPIRLIGLMSDITERRQWEETQRLLVAELQHRTRNLLAVVQSIAQQTMLASETLEDFRERFNNRLAALSRVQGLLSRSHKEPITIGALVGMELEALGAPENDVRVTVAGPEVQVRNSTVQMLALAIHELATNARKYGALASHHGRLSVTWEVKGEGPGERHLALEWQEEGIERQSQPTGRGHPGYGRTLIERGLAYSLSARTKFELGDDCLRCSIVLPLDAGSEGDFVT